MSLDLLPPGLLIIGAGLLLALRDGPILRAIALLGPVGALALLAAAPVGTAVHSEFLTYQLTPYAIQPLGRLFAIVFSLMALVGTLFALAQARRLELSAALVYAGSAVGAATCGDLFTLFVYWEVMAIGSTLVLWAAGTPASERAALRYLLVHLSGGAVMMAGIAGHVATGGSLALAPMGVGSMGVGSLATWLILIGVLINAGAPPLSAWIADAYPEASATGTVFLSAFTTKTAVYVLLLLFPGTQVLIYIGLYMIFYGIVYALLENDMRRILAYSIVNQVGFMVCGAGIGTAMAVNGAAAHAFVHIIYKALLLMSAGSVLFMTGKRRCTELGGLIHTMPLTAVCGIIGALAISAFPLTSGFVAKSMITQAAVEQHLLWVWLALQAASAGVFLHAGIKFPWFVFFQKDSGLRPGEPPMNMRWAMIAFSVLCIWLGVFPHQLYNLLPVFPGYAPYTGPHVVGQLQLLLFSGLAFFVLLPLMKRTLTISLDFDWIYRKVLVDVTHRLLAQSPVLIAFFANIGAALGTWLAGLSERLHGERGVAITGLTAHMLVWTVASLGLILLFLYDFRW